MLKKLDWEMVESICNNRFRESGWNIGAVNERPEGSKVGRAKESRRWNERRQHAMALNTYKFLAVGDEMIRQSLLASAPLYCVSHSIRSRRLISIRALHAICGGFPRQRAVTRRGTEIWKASTQKDVDALLCQNHLIRTSVKLEK